MILFDGQDPEYAEELILNQGITKLLSIRDLCLLMRHSRLGAQSIVGGGYEYNELQLEIWFLEKIIRILDKVLILKFSKIDDIQQFYSETLSSDLKLDEIVPGKYFDKLDVLNNGYKFLESTKILFTNFSRVVKEDWKFL